MPNDSAERKTFRAKEGIIFLRQEMGVRKIKRKASQTATAKQCQTVSYCEASATGICGGIRLCV